MNKRFRPIHSGFETLRLAGDEVRSTQGYSRFGFATNEQMIARGTGINSRTARPNAIFRTSSNIERQALRLLFRVKSTQHVDDPDIASAQHRNIRAYPRRRLRRAGI